MRKRIYIPILLSTMMLYGCVVTGHTIEFTGDKVQVNEAIDACLFIKSVDGIEITDDMRESNRIVLDDGVLECSPLKNNQLGNLEISYSYDNQVYKYTVMVVDEEAPVINVLDEYEVEVGNEYFDLENRVVFSDNYDKEMSKDIQGDFDINTPGTYDLKAIATDSSGNTTEKEFRVIVIEKDVPDPEVQIVEKPVYVPSGPSQSGSETIDTPSSNDGSSQGNSNTPSGSGSQGQSNPLGPFISGVKDLSVSVGTSLNDLVYMLGQGVSASSAITIDYSNVNLSVPGSYAVWYYGNDGATASCTVSVN